jgi:hypothetical protein
MKPIDTSIVRSIVRRPKSHTEASSGNDNVSDSTIPTTYIRDSSFLESMTFNSVQPNCSCDECVCGNNSRKKNVQIPETIRDAIKSHKRMKCAEMPLQRSQLRTLLGQHSFGTISNDLAVWEWTIPPFAEPIVEFGNPMIYRIIWLKRFHHSLIIKRIGCGIIGSKSEEQGRLPINWVENDVFLTKSEDRKAVGFVVEPNISATIHGGETSSALTGPVTFYVAKIPAELIKDHVLPLLSIQDDQELLDSISANKSMKNTVTCFEIIRRTCGRTVCGTNNEPKLLQNVIHFQMHNDDKNLFRRSMTLLCNK